MVCLARLAAITVFFAAGSLTAQFGRGGDWKTSGSDAQRSAWVRSDPKISRANLLKPGFQFLWKIALEKQAALTTPSLLDFYIGYRGFRSLGFVGASSGAVFALDTDLTRMEWSKQFPATPGGGSASCPGGMTANVTQTIGLAFPGAGRGFGGRGGPARSGVGEPGQGSLPLQAWESTRPATPPARTTAPPGPAPGGPGFGGRVRTPDYVYVLSGDGALHSLYVSNGDEPNPPVPFLPPGANAIGLTVTGTAAYVATTGACRNVANGVWAMDLASRQVTKWVGDVAGSAGAAFAPDGTIYVATTTGTLVALDPKTMNAKGSYTASGRAFTSSPVVFSFKERTLVAAMTDDGRIHVLDTAQFGAGEHKTPAAVAPASTAAGRGGSLASWQGGDGTRWLLYAAANAIVSLRLVEEGGALALQPAWTSPAMDQPLPPMVINDVVFAVSGAGAATLHALDGVTGKELWNSGKEIAARGGVLAGGGSQVYVAAADGTFYAFGYAIEH